MNILIANYEMENFFGGTQTWTVTIAKALRKLGHTAHFTGVNGKINPAFQPEYQPLLSSYDLLIVNGNITLEKFKNRAPVTMFISHGVLPQLEQPVEGADIYLGVSEEVRDNIIKKGFKCDGVVRNPIDLEKFTTSNPVKKIETIGFLDRRRKFPFISQIRKHYKTIQIGTPPTPNIKEELDKCDLVVARGRGIYEAMALSKPVIVSGNNSGHARRTELMDGYVDNESFYEFRKNNCSGRNKKLEVRSPEMFLEEIKKASVEQGIRNRKLMEENNDSILIASQLINFYENYNRTS